MQRDNHARLWILTDGEMFRLSLYASEAAKRFQANGGQALYEEATEVAEEIDNILEQTEYYQRLKANLEILMA